MLNRDSQTVAFGDTVLFVGKDRKTFIRTLRPEGRLQTHYGVIKYEDIIGLPYGTRLQTHLEQPVWMFAPTLDDLVRHLKRESQIVFPKDLGYLLMKLGIQPGVRVIEAGTGSGGMTITLAVMVGETGRVYSYDRRHKMQEIARRNLELVGVQSRVELKERDITAGFDEQDVHAVFLDVPDPWEYLDQAWEAMRGGGFLACIVPTMNQVITLDTALHQGPWFLVEIEEVLLRNYKTLPARVRPDDQMVGHTGYLVFARTLAERLTVEAPAAEADKPETNPEGEAGER